jgi:hypothetical protein
MCSSTFRLMVIKISRNFLIVHQRSSNFHVIYNGFNLTVFDGLSNNNEIAWNLDDHQSKSRLTYL